MTVEQMMRRHIADWCYAKWGPAAPSYSLIRKRALSAQQLLMFREAATAIRELGTLKSLYRTGLTVPVLKSIVRRQKAAWLRQGIRLGVVTIDHMGLVLASGSAQKRSEAQGEVARDTKRIASELEVPVIALVQLSRKVEERDDCRPRLSDVRDSGEWEENADGVIGLYREAYYAQRETEPKRHDLKLAWEDRRSSKWVDAMFLKIREGEMQTVQLWADLPRNAIRGGIPDSAFLGSHVDLLDPDQALLHDTATLFE
jgi:replicative DNA helicase